MSGWSIVEQYRSARGNVISAEGHNTKYPATTPTNEQRSGSKLLGFDFLFQFLHLPGHCTAVNVSHIPTGKKIQGVWTVCIEHLLISISISSPLRLIDKIRGMFSIRFSFYFSYLYFTHIHVRLLHTLLHISYRFLYLFLSSFSLSYLSGSKSIIKGGKVSRVPSHLFIFGFFFLIFFSIFLLLSDHATSRNG